MTHNTTTACHRAYVSCVLLVVMIWFLKASRTTCTQHYGFEASNHVIPIGLLCRFMPSNAHVDFGLAFVTASLSCVHGTSVAFYDPFVLTFARKQTIKA